MILRERTPERKANDNHAISGLHDGIIRHLTYMRGEFISKATTAVAGGLRAVGGGEYAHDSLIYLSRAEVYAVFAGYMKACASRIDHAGVTHPAFLSREETILAMALNEVVAHNSPSSFPKDKELDAHAAAVREGILNGRFPDRSLDSNYIRWLTVIGGELRDFYNWK